MSDLELARLFGTTTGDSVDKLGRCEQPLRLSRTTDLLPGREADERPQPASRRT